VDWSNGLFLAGARGRLWPPEVHEGEPVGSPIWAILICKGVDMFGLPFGEAHVANASCGLPAQTVGGALCSRRRALSRT
jgi:hypothetical protein